MAGKLIRVMLLLVTALVSSAITALSCGDAYQNLGLISDHICLLDCAADACERDSCSNACETGFIYFCVEWT